MCRRGRRFNIHRVLPRHGFVLVTAAGATHSSLARTQNAIRRRRGFSGRHHHRRRRRGRGRRRRLLLLVQVLLRGVARGVARPLPRPPRCRRRRPVLIRLLLLRRLLRHQAGGASHLAGPAEPRQHTAQDDRLRCAGRGRGACGVGSGWRAARGLARCGVSWFSMHDAHTASPYTPSPTTHQPPATPYHFSLSAPLPLPLPLPLVSLSLSPLPLMARLYSPSLSLSLSPSLYLSPSPFGPEFTAPPSPSPPPTLLPPPSRPPAARWRWPAPSRSP